MTLNLKKVAAAVSAISIIVIAVWGFFGFIGTPPYAEANRVDLLEAQVAANTEAGWLRQLENALARGDQAQIRRICNIVAKLYGYRASGCP